MTQKTRAVVYLGPKQHAKIAAIKRSLKLSSVAEAHRLAIDSFDADTKDADLDTLAKLLAQSNKEVASTLKTAETEIRKTLRYLRKHRGMSNG